MKGVLKFYFAMAATTIVGCASTNQPEVPASVRMNSEGAVVAKLVSNASNVGDGVKRFRSIEVVNTQTKENYTLYAEFNRYQYNSHLSIGGWLPAGNYNITGLHAYGVPPLSATFSTKKLGYQFSVKAGQVNDLNTLIFQPLGDGKASLAFFPSTPDKFLLKGIMGDAASQLAAKPIEELTISNNFPLKSAKYSTQANGAGLIVNAFIAAGSQSLHGSHKSQWEDIKDSAQLLQTIKQSTTTLNDRLTLDDGRTVYASTLGQLLVRTKDGVWSNIDTGIDVGLISLLKAGNQIIASTDDARFLIGDAELKHWKLLDVELKESIAARMFSIKNNKILLVLKTPLGLEVRVMDENFAKISEPIQSKTNEELGVASWDYLSDKGELLAVQDGRNIKILTRYDNISNFNIDTEQWSEIKLEQGTAFLEKDPKSNVLTMPIFGAFGSSTITTDGGKTFTKIKHSMLSRMRFVTPQLGFALIFDMGMSSSSNHFAMTQDGGKNWVHGKELEDACTDWDVIDERMLCITRSGIIVSTTNAKDLTIERLIR